MSAKWKEVTLVKIWTWFANTILCIGNTTYNHFFRTNLYSWFIDFNGMSTCLGLFYTERLRNHVHCAFISTFFKVFFFVHVHIEYKWFLNRYIWTIDWTPNRVRVDLGVMAMKWYFSLPRSGASPLDVI